MDGAADLTDVGSTGPPVEPSEPDASHRAEVPVSRAARASIAVFAVPMVLGLHFVIARPGRLLHTTDGQLFVNVADNLRHHASLSSPADHFWITLSPAQTLAALPRVPVLDIGPVYPVILALAPLPVDRWMWLVNLVSLVAAVLLVGSLVYVATRSAIASVLAQLFLLAGPSQHTIFERHNIANMAGAMTYDVTALALLLGGVLALARSRSRRGDAAAVALLAAAALTRYALLAVPIGLLVVGLVRWSASRSARPPRVVGLAAATVAVVIGWQYVIAPLLVGRGAPKPISYHRGSAEPMLTMMLGWLGLDGLNVDHAVAPVLLAAVVFGWLIWLILRRPTHSVSFLLSVVAVSMSIMILLGQAYLAADILLNDERQFLPVRAAFTGLVAIEVAGGVRSLTARLAPAARHVAAGAVVVAAVVALAVFGTAPWIQGLSPDPELSEASRAAIEANPGAVVMSGNPGLVYALTGVSGLENIRDFEYATDRSRDVDDEVADLAEELGGRQLLVVAAPISLPPVDLGQMPCVELVASMPDAQLYDLSNCRTPPGSDQSAAE